MRANISGSPIQNLPNEILLEIIITYWEMQKTLHEDRKVPQNLPVHRQYHLALPMLVCRFWCELIVSSPTLWQEIDINGPNTQQLELALIRSQDAPLALFFHRHRAARAAVPLVLPHAHRIRSLHLPPLRFPLLEGHKVDMPSFLPLLRKQLLSLEELVIPASNPNRNRIPGYTLLALSDKQFPALQTLHLACAAIAWTPRIISRLRSLSLVACIPHGPPLSYSKFLDVLEGCNSLEELQLWDRFLSSATTFSPLASDRMVDLPRMRQLVINDTPTITSWFLARLCMPHRAAIRVIGRLSEDEVRARKGLFTSLLPWDPDGRPSVRIPSAQLYGKIAVSYGSFTLEVYPDETQSANLSLTLQLEPQSLFNWNEYLEGALDDFCDLFFGARLEMLYINNADYTFAADPMTWFRLLSAFPELHAIGTFMFGSPSPLFSALQHTPIQPDEDGVLQPPVCPQLGILSIEGTTHSEGLIELILAMLRCRHHFGLRQLDMLQLWLYTADAEQHQAYTAAIGLYQEEITSLVGCVLWGARGGSLSRTTLSL